MEPTLVVLLGIVALLIVNLVALLLLRPRREGQESLAPLQTQMQGLSESIDRRLSEGTNRMFESMQTLFGESRRLATDIRDTVNNQLIEVTKGVTETKDSTKQMLTIAEQLRNLEKVFNHHQQLGNLGEQSLELILTNVLGADPKMFKMQYQFPGGDRVDAVIFAQEGKIPIDAKFPLANYPRLIDEADHGRRPELANAFKHDVRKRIDETARYVRPKDGTVPFAFMFIPAEGIFYDLLVNEIGGRSLLEYAYEKSVVIVSPTTFAAYLQSVLYGFRAFRVEEGAREIAKNVETLSQHLRAYEDCFRKVGNSLSATVNNYNAAYKELARIDTDVLRITGDRVGIEAVALDRPLAAE